METRRIFNPCDLAELVECDFLLSQTDLPPIRLSSEQEEKEDPRTPVDIFASAEELANIFYAAATSEHIAKIRVNVDTSLLQICNLEREVIAVQLDSQVMGEFLDSFLTGEELKISQAGNKNDCQEVTSFFSPDVRLLLIAVSAASKDAFSEIYDFYPCETEE